MDTLKSRLVFYSRRVNCIANHLTRKETHPRALRSTGDSAANQHQA